MDSSSVSVTTKLGHLLSTHYEMIELILKHLDLKDLNQASLVCNSWNNVTNNIKKKRTELQLKIKECSEACSKSFGDENYFKNCININSLPQLCITIINCNLYNRYLKHLREISKEELVTYKKSAVHHMLKQCIPASCTSFLLTSSLCVSDQLKVFDYRWFRQPPPLDEVYITLSMPEIREVKIQTFEIDSDECDIDIITRANIDYNEPLKCLLLFENSSNEAKLSIETLLKDVKSKQIDPIVIAVFMGHPLDVLDDRRNQLDFIKGITFSGKNIHATSVIIPENVSDKVGIENYILKLKNSEFPCLKNKSIAFMFPENKRGNIYQHDITVFQQHFPDTEVLGMKCGDVLKMSDSGTESLESAILPPNFYRPANWPQDQPFCFKRSNGPTQIVVISWL